jgi:hypothetical protein
MIGFPLFIYAMVITGSRPGAKAERYYSQEFSGTWRAQHL